MYRIELASRRFRSRIISIIYEGVMAISMQRVKIGSEGKMGCLQPKANSKSAVDRSQNRGRPAPSDMDENWLIFGFWIGFVGGLFWGINRMFGAFLRRYIFHF